MKRILLTLCVFLSTCLIMAQERFTVGKYTYKVTSRAEVELVDVEETIQSSYLSPSVTYQGVTYYITSIGLRAFSYCSSLTSVVIPNGVRSIGGRAFQDCKALYSVTIPSSVVSIGWEAFLGCSSLLSIIIPESVTEIGDCAFHDCSSLISVAIPETITEKVDLAFCGNTPPVEEARRKREEEARRKADLFAKNFSGSENDPSGNDSDKDGSNPQEGTAVGKGSGSMGGGKWQLSGRDCLSLPRPENKHNQAGKVVVNITIDVNGNVTNVSLGVGSSISDRATIQLALDAAWKAKFTPGDRPQRGTITYIFKLI
jgi:TonB family protein